jgi:hypothetical protein
MLSPPPATTALRPTPSVDLDPDCVVEITSESDPIMAGDHGIPVME